MITKTSKKVFIVWYFVIQYNVKKKEAINRLYNNDRFKRSLDSKQLYSLVEFSLETIKNAWKISDRQL